MNDVVVRYLVPRASLRASICCVSGAAEAAGDAHGLGSTSYAMLSQALAGASLLASTLKEQQRINLQLECDGPLRGALVDAGVDGTLRGYAKNPALSIGLSAGEFRWRPALGNSGFLSVLRPQPDGSYYRSSVELTAFDLEGDLAHFLSQSDQIASRLALVPSADFRQVVGVLVQALPDGDETALGRIGQGLHQRVASAMSAGADIDGLAAAALQGFDYQQVASVPLQWKCNCSKERVLQMLASLGANELRSLADELGEAVVTCEFCNTKHRADATELRALMATPSA